MEDGPVIRIESLAPGGRGVARMDSGKVALVGGAAPGDRVRVTVEQEKKNLTLARVLEVLEPSPWRVDPPCPLAGLCGGCSWSHLDVQAQRRYKHEILVSELQRARMGEDLDIAPLATGADLGYRWRTRLHLSDGTLGTMRQASHKVLAHGGCPVLAPALDRFARQAAELCETLPVMDAQLELYVDAKANRGLHVLVDDPISAPTWQRAARELDVTSLVVQGARNGSPTPWLQEDSARHPLSFTPGVFVQANREMNETLVRTVVREAGSGSSFAEVYAGAGNFTVHLASRFERGWAAEGHRAATHALHHNLGPGGPVAVHGEDERASHRRLQRTDAVDVLVADPPRRGMKRLLGRRGRGLPRRIVMISCHPVTAVRDMKTLVSQAGYRLTGLQALDMFPHTHHLELVAHLSR